MLPFLRFSSGVAFRYRYGELLNAFTEPPVFRTTSQGSRTLSVCITMHPDGFFVAYRSHGGFCVSNSFIFLMYVCDYPTDSLNFAAGFFDVRTYHTDYHQEITIEADKVNNTLAPYYVCPNANTEDIGYFGDTQASKWANIYLQTARMRLQTMIQGFNLTITDLVHMQDLCAYEVVPLFTVYVYS